MTTTYTHHVSQVSGIGEDEEMGIDPMDFMGAHMGVPAQSDIQAPPCIMGQCAASACVGITLFATRYEHTGLGLA